MKQEIRIREVFGAYEFAYWAVYGVAVIALYIAGYANVEALITAFVAVGLAGWLTGVRLSREKPRER